MNVKSDSYTLTYLSKCCPALPEAWAPANAGAHAEPLYTLFRLYVFCPRFLWNGYETRLKGNICVNGLKTRRIVVLQLLLLYVPSVNA